MTKPIPDLLTYPRSGMSGCHGGENNVVKVGTRFIASRPARPCQRNDVVLQELARVYVRDALRKWVPEANAILVSAVIADASLELRVGVRGCKRQLYPRTSASRCEPHLRYGRPMSEEYNDAWMRARAPCAGSKSSPRFAANGRITERLWSVPETCSPLCLLLGMKLSPATSTSGLS